MNKYKVGDVIAFRVTDVSGRDSHNGELSIPINGDSWKGVAFGAGCCTTAILERLPDGVKVFDPKTWTVRIGDSKPGDYYSRGVVSSLGAGGVYERGGFLLHESGCHFSGGADCVCIAPPNLSPCPELLAKIEALEADMKEKQCQLAELKKRVQ